MTSRTCIQDQNFTSTRGDVPGPVGASLLRNASSCARARGHVGFARPLVGEKVVQGRAEPGTRLGVHYFPDLRAPDSKACVLAYVQVLYSRFDYGDVLVCANYYRDRVDANQAYVRRLDLGKIKSVAKRPLNNYFRASLRRHHVFSHGFCVRVAAHEKSVPVKRRPRPSLGLIEPDGQ